MLRHIHIKNFALMDDQAVDFEPGLTVITGETGAGKSLVVEAIAALCGEKIEDLSIRSGKDFVEISGIFDPPEPARELLRASGVEADNDLVIRRRSERGRKQQSYINDHVVSAGLLKDTAKKIIDLVGQYENQSLFFAPNHLLLLDRYAGLDELLAECRVLFRSYRGLQKQLQDLVAVAKVKGDRLDILRHDLAEIERADLRADEEENLLLEKNLLASGEKRSKLSGEVLDLLYEGDENLYGKAARIRKLAGNLCPLDTRLQEFAKKIEMLSTLADDVYREISEYRQKIDYSAERLEYVLGRLETITRLKKRFGRSVAEVQAHADNARKELAAIENYDENIQSLNQEITGKNSALAKLQERLSQKRKAAGRALEKKIGDVLHRLGMEKAQCAFRFTEKDLDEDGKDEVEFYISTNPGEELKPLRKIGSGGEISRITLGLKTIMSAADGIPTVIFDEVDTGIGGRVAEAVGELLSQASKTHQIICVTHLPQISMYADTHYAVQKETRAKETFVRIVKLDGDMRTAEIARMLGGKEITKKTLEHAAEIMQKGKRR
jgi:DNA repair protein RecN (Recombination protein N)